MSSSNQNRLLALLGPEYRIRTVDTEECIYRKLNSHYDIEISGTSRKNHPLSLYVWDISGGDTLGAKIVEKVFDLKNDDELRHTLMEVGRKYQG